MKSLTRTVAAMGFTLLIAGVAGSAGWAGAGSRFVRGAVDEASPSGDSATGAITDFALLGEREVRIRSARVTAGSVGVNRGDLTVLRRLDAGAIAADGVKFSGRTTCSSLLANRVARASLGCGPATPFAGPLFADLASACGVGEGIPTCDPAADVTVPHGATRVLTPGVYGSLLVTGGGRGPATVELGAGDYVFCDVRLGRQAAVKTTGAAVVRVGGDLVIGDGAKFGDAAGSKLLVGGRTVHIGRTVAMAGDVCAPHATVSLADGVVVDGCIAADGIRARNDVTVDCTPDTGSTSTTTSTSPATTTTVTTATTTTVTTTTSTTSTTTTSSTTTTAASTSTTSSSTTTRPSTTTTAPTTSSTTASTTSSTTSTTTSTTTTVPTTTTASTTSTTTTSTSTTTTTTTATVPTTTTSSSTTTTVPTTTTTTTVPTTTSTTSTTTTTTSTTTSSTTTTTTSTTTSTTTTSTTTTSTTSTTAPTTTTTTTTPTTTTTTTTGPPVCGNGTREGAEQCDDGNDDNTDACTNQCQNARCGDGITRFGVEQCDDGNTNNADCCNNGCQLTPSVCGNGCISPGETCDDGNTANGDACPSTCVINACTASGTTQQVTISLKRTSPPSPSSLVAFNLLFDYPDGQVSIPGSGSAASVATATPFLLTPTGRTVSRNDLDYAIRLSVLGTSNMLLNTNATAVFHVTFDLCNPAAAPTAGQFTCSILGATASGGTDFTTAQLAGLACTVSVP